MSKSKNSTHGSVPAGASPQFQQLIRGKISSGEYVRQLKERVDAGHTAGKPSAPRPAPGR
jgi:hypothetical protein